MPIYIIDGLITFLLPSCHPISPEGCYDIIYGQVVSIVSDQPKNKDAIMVKVRVHEISNHVLLALVIQGNIKDFMLFRILKMPANITILILAEDNSEEPLQEAQAGNNGDKQHPNPEEGVDFLNIHVNRKHTLYCVSMGIPQAPNRVVTHSDPWETSRVHPVCILNNILDQFISVQRVVGPQDSIQQEQLAEHVGNVDQLGEKVEYDEIHALGRTAKTTAYFANHGPDFKVRAVIVLLARGHEEPVHLIDDEP